MLSPEDIVEAQDGVRRPGNLGASRIGALATLPVFFMLEDRRAVLAGSSAGALWKAELLEAAGARVDLFGEFTPEDLAQFNLGERVRRQARHWIDADFKGAALAVPMLVTFTTLVPVPLFSTSTMARPMPAAVESPLAALA